jgi:hypothetical protein
MSFPHIHLWESPGLCNKKLAAKCLSNGVGRGNYITLNMKGRMGKEQNYNFKTTLEA